MALIVETSIAYGREILHGISQYLRENGPWNVFIEHRSMQDPAPPWLRDWDGDGIIATLYPQYSDLILESGIPAVDVDDQLPHPGVPRVQSDQEAIGSMAAQHLVERGFSRFAFIGYPEFVWSRRRQDGFERTLRGSGHGYDEYEESQPVTWGHQLPSWEAEIEAIARWIERLPRPVGVLACNDFRGFQVLDACRRADIAVPEEVAVIGVDNEVLACEFAHPPLSSVIPDCRRIGYEAAEMLDHLMRGRPVREPHPEVPPFGIATRQSTDVMAITDPVVAAAMRFIRERSCDGIRVDDVLNHVAVSRSVLQRRFLEMTGRTIHTAIANVRMQRVKLLLAETDLPLPDIAERAGFSHADYMTTAFRKATGSTPGSFRREHRSLRDDAPNGTFL